MKEEQRNIKILYVTIFCFFLTLLFLSPISGDDWGNYLVGKKGLHHMIGQALGMYFSWEGRLISRVFINLLTYHKWLWNILNSILITGIIYSIGTFVKTKKKEAICLGLLTILGMNIYTFSQVITWIAGNITYLFPIVFFLFYLAHIKKHWQLPSSKKEWLICSLVNIMLPMFVEHMAVLLIIVNLSVVLIQFWQTKKWNIPFLIYSCLSMLSTLGMFLSPGTRLRNSMEDTAFNQLSLIEKIIHNVPNFIFYTWIVNSFLLVMVTITNLHRWLQTKRNSCLKIIGVCYLLIIPIGTLFIYNLSFFIKIPEWLNWNNPTQPWIQIYWLSYTFVHLFLLWKKRENQTDKWNLIYTILGILANAIMLLSPTWGYRTSLASYLLLLFSPIQQLLEMKIPKIFWKTVTGLTFCMMLVWLVFYFNIDMTQKELKQKIKIQLEEKKEVIEIPSFPNYANCNINPTNEFHIKQFKEYYQIPLEKEVVLTPLDWRYPFIK